MIEIIITIRIKPW